MARRGAAVTEEPKATAEETEPMFIWRRVHGKHHFRTPEGIKTIRPGDTVKASATAYAHDRSWELVGPESAEEEGATEYTFKMEPAEEQEGYFNVISIEDNEQVNSYPLTEAEAKALVEGSAKK